MVKKQTREHIWYQMASMERYVRYYEFLHKRYWWHRLIIRGTIAFGSMGLLGTLLFQSDALSQTGSGFAATLLALGVAIVTAWDIVENPSDKAVTIERVWRDISPLRIEYEILWVNLESGRLSDEEVIEQSNGLFSRVHQILEKLDVGTSSRLNKIAAEGAYAYLNHRYRHAT